jgi:hypothetical protein
MYWGNNIHRDMSVKQNGLYRWPFVLATKAVFYNAKNRFSKTRSTQFLV